MCVLSTLCGNVDKHSQIDIYIYEYIYIVDDLAKQGDKKSAAIILT